MSEVNFEDVAKELNIMFARKPRSGQKRNIIFWYNGDGKFQDKLDTLQLDNAEILVYTGNNSFKTDTSQYFLTLSISLPSAK